MVRKYLKWILKHKVISLFAAVVIFFGGYFGVKAVSGGAEEARYVLGEAKKTTIVSSVSGGGQVAVLNQVDFKSKVSGNIVYVNVKNGSEIKAGTLLAQVDSTDAQKTVRDAKTALETAELEYEELIAPPDELTLLQAENSLIQLKESKETAEDNLIKAKEDGFNSVVSAFFDLPAIIADANNIIYGNEINKAQDNAGAYFDLVSLNEPIRAGQYRDIAVESYDEAYAAYVKNFDNYKLVNRSSDSLATESIISETYEGAKDIAEAFKNADNYLSFVKDIMAQKGLEAPKAMAAHQAAIKSDTGKINSIISSLSSAQRTFKDSRDSIVKSARSIEEKELSIKKMKEGANALSLRAKKISMTQKEDALISAEQNLADYFIRAPFDGLAAKINVKKGDSVSGGTVIATIVTKQQIAQLSLNEVDVAKIKIRQKATLTFDAINELSITGEVAEIDSLGTVSQGVVSYNVKIYFDTQDERVKPGMSVSAAIITEAKQDVLAVPVSSVKSQGGSYYVELFDKKSDTSEEGGQGISSSVSPRQQPVMIGVSNDELTEIISGLNENDQIIVRTITVSSAKPAAASAPSLFGGSASRGATGGGNVRFVR